MHRQICTFYKSDGMPTGRRKALHIGLYIHVIVYSNLQAWFAYH